MNKEIDDINNIILNKKLSFEAIKKIDYLLTKIKKRQRKIYFINQNIKELKKEIKNTIKNDHNY